MEKLILILGVPLMFINTFGGVVALVWLIVIGDYWFLIGINDAENKNTCTMASSYNSINDIKSILKEFYKIELLHKENQGIQNIEMYKVNLTQSFNNSGILVLNYSDQTGINLFQ